jgi:hypothetical protein
MSNNGEKKVKVLVQFIQDRSGSMSTVWSETLNGYRQFVKGLKEGKDDGVDYLFTLTCFDTVIDTPIKEKPIGEVTGEELDKFPPRGSTALYDAVGRTLNETKFQADKYICVIVTDGQENSSREWSKDALHTAIDDKIKMGNWTFTYLGTQPETWDDATSIGVGVGSTVTYNPQNIKGTYTYMANTVRNFAASPQTASSCLMTDNSFNDTKTMDVLGMKTRVDVDKTIHKSSTMSSKTWR